MRKRLHAQWWLGLIGAVLLVSSTVLFSPTASAMTGDTEPCMASDGRSLPEIYGVAVAIVSHDCNRVRAGSRWTPSVPWVMNTDFATVPAWFSTTATTPLEDLLAKLESVTYVVSPDYEPLHYERTVPVGNKLWTGELPEAPGQPAGLAAANTVTVTSLDPLPPGRHYVEVYWNLTEPSCDGLGARQPTNCLPAGGTLVRRMHFYVE